MSASKQDARVLQRKPRKISAGSVKMTPPATDSPGRAGGLHDVVLEDGAAPAPAPAARLMESTAMGMDAATVSPARRPTYTVTAPKMIPKMPPKKSERKVSSWGFSVGEMYGLNAGSFTCSASSAKVGLLGKVPHYSNESRAY